MFTTVGGRVSLMVYVILYSHSVGVTGVEHSDVWVPIP